MPSGIYCFENQINRKVYIGQTVDLERRLYEHEYHLSRGTDKATALQRAVTKYGRENFKVFILWLCDVSELNDLEVKFISEYHSNDKNHGYNLSSGGNSGMLGYKHSEEFCEKVSMAKKGWVMGEAQREFISRLHTGKVVRPETREKISQANTGSNHPMYGKKHKDESKKMMRDSHLGEKAHQFGKKSGNSSSSFFGVHKQNSRGYIYWIASVKVLGDNIYIGSSKDETESAMMYDKYVIEHRLPNPLNFPELYQ